MKILFILFSIFMLVGCDVTNVSEEDKNNYIEYKERCFNNKEATDIDDIMFDIKISLDRISDEEVSYRVLIDNAREDMNNVTAIITHDYFTEDIFPSIGILDDPVSLKVGDTSSLGIMLVGYINVPKDIDGGDINFNVLIEYVNSSMEKKVIYYKSTNNL